MTAPLLLSADLTDGSVILHKLSIYLYLSIIYLSIHAFIYLSVHIYFFIVVLGGYIVAFTKVLTIYQIHHT
jgi:hypothetical protein